MSKKKTFESYADLAKRRNHRLISVTDENTPAAGDVKVWCNTCKNEFRTSAKSYDNARKTGCPYCKSIKARAQAGIQRNSTPGNPNQAAQRQTRKQRRLAQRLAKRALIQQQGVISFEGLQNFLKNENKGYSSFMLEMISRQNGPTPLKAEKIEEHHIIPKFAGGTDAKWNLVSLTPEEHVKAHELRYKDYGEFGDYNFLQTRGDAVLGRIGRNPNFDAKIRANARRGAFTQQQAGIGIFAEGAAQRGGEASRRAIENLSPEERRVLNMRHFSQMDEPLKKVLQEGATFYHESTQVTYVLKPMEAVTLTELKDILARSLPEGNIDRNRLEKAKKNANVTSAFAKIIKGVAGRPSAYGWKILR